MRSGILRVSYESGLGDPTPVMRSKRKTIPVQNLYFNGKRKQLRPAICSHSSTTFELVESVLILIPRVCPNSIQTRISWQVDSHLGATKLGYFQTNPPNLAKPLKPRKRVPDTDSIEAFSLTLSISSSIQFGLPLGTEHKSEISVGFPKKNFHPAATLSSRRGFPVEGPRQVS